MSNIDKLNIDLDAEGLKCTNCGSDVSKQSERVFYPCDYIEIYQTEVDVCPSCDPIYKKKNAPWITDDYVF